MGWYGGGVWDGMGVGYGVVWGWGMGWYGGGVWGGMGVGYGVVWGGVGLVWNRWSRELEKERGGAVCWL